MSEVLRKVFRLATFFGMATVSMMCANAILSLRLGRKLVGLALLAALVAAVLFVTPKYLLALWSLSNRFTLTVLSEGSQALPSSSPQGAERIR